LQPRGTTVMSEPLNHGSLTSAQIPTPTAAAADPDWWQDYQRARQLSQQGLFAEARALYEQLQHGAKALRFAALVQNDLGVLLAEQGELRVARQRLEAALTLDDQCDAARRNLALLDQRATGTAAKMPAPDRVLPAQSSAATSSCKVAILSFLFNWPSTGGG